jgi:hypothetical protein
MAREELQEASNALRRAAERAGDSEVEERVYNQSNQMAKLATRDRGPDHGRLDRHEHTLRSLADEAGEDARADVEAAIEAIRSYRETVEGV